jgi:hypothetical protein
MVRATLQLEQDLRPRRGSLDLLFTFSATGGNLGGGLHVPSNWIADFRRSTTSARPARPT